MKKMLKRADGSYSQRGLWDNMRANKGSGKEPTKDMLKQENKIKRSEKVKARSEKVLGKAQATWTKAEALKKFGNESSENMAGDKFANPADKANQLYKKAERQGNRAKKLKEKSEYLEAIGKKTGGKKNSWLEESKELKFGGPSNKYQTAGPKMDTKTAVGQVFQGKMTAAQGQAAIGKTPKPAMNTEQKAEFMSKLKTYGKKTGGKKRMGGKNC